MAVAVDNAPASDRGLFLNGAAPKFAPPALTTDDSLVAVLMMACILLTAIIFVRYEKHDKIYTGEMSGLVIIFLVCVYNVGRVQAQSEVFSNKNLYDVSVKDSTIRDAHLLRSSSSGFIFAIEGVVTYLPKDVVLALNAKNRIEK
jgi:hypothetical protein